MEGMSRPPGEMRRPERQPGQAPDRTWRIVALAILGLFVLVLLVQGLAGSSTSTSLSYTDFLTDAQAGHVLSAKINNDNGHISGKLDDANQTPYSTKGPKPLPGTELDIIKAHVKTVTFDNSTTSLLTTLLPFLLYGAIIIGFFYWMSRRAQGQMTGLMSIGRS